MLELDHTKTSLYMALVERQALPRVRVLSVDESLAAYRRLIRAFAREPVPANADPLKCRRTVMWDGFKGIGGSTWDIEPDHVLQALASQRLDKEPLLVFDDLRHGVCVVETNAATAAAITGEYHIVDDLYITDIPCTRMVCWTHEDFTFSCVAARPG